MEPAATIIRKLGGTRRAAARLGVPPSTVNSWRATGRIPAQHQAKVLEVSREHEAGVTPEDFFQRPTESADAPEAA